LANLLLSNDRTNTMTFGIYHQFAELYAQQECSS
jgi:hypothetical protein